MINIIIIFIIMIKVTNWWIGVVDSCPPILVLGHHGRCVSCLDRAGA